MSDNIWTNDQLVPDSNNAHGLSFSPAAAVFNDRVYVFHQGRGNDGRIWYTTFDGANWTQDLQARSYNPYEIDGSPALAVFNAKLYCFHGGGSGYLWFNTLDLQGNWSDDVWVGYPSPMEMAGSPGVAVWKDKVHVVYRGRGDRANRLMYTSAPINSFGNGFGIWSTPSVVNDQGNEVHLNGSPTLTVYKDQLLCFHKGTDETFNSDLLAKAGKAVPAFVTAGAGAGGPIGAAIGLGLGMGLAAGVAIGEAIKVTGSRQSDWTWLICFDGTQWGPDQLCPTAEDAYGVNSDSIAAIEYKNWLVCIRQGRENSYLWGGQFNGATQTWLKDVMVGVPGNTFTTTGAPALVVYQDILYCIHQGKDDSGWMWMTSVHA